MNPDKARSADGWKGLFSLHFSRRLPVRITPASSSYTAMNDQPSQTNRFDRSKTTRRGSNGKLEFASSTMRGFRRKQEDRISVHLDLPATRSSKGQSHPFLCVLDGHRGSTMADHVSTSLHKTLAGLPDYADEDFKKALRAAFIAMDDDVRNNKVMAYEAEEEDKNYPQEAGVPTISGCTATVALFSGNRITVASVGDSRAVLCRGGKAFPLSTDHTPFRPEEYKRLQDGGIPIIMGKVAMLLNMSRTLGDINMKHVNVSPDQQPISGVPEIEEVDLTDEDEFMVLATDGVWNALRNKESIARDMLKRLAGAKAALVNSRVVQADEVSDATVTGIIEGLNKEKLGTAVVTLSDEESYKVYQAGEAASNQNLCDTVRWCIGQRLPLEKICECVLDFGLENFNGNDNMSMIIVPILGERTLEKWYTWMVRRMKKGYGRRIPQDIEAFEPRDARSLSLKQVVAKALQT